MAGRLGGRTIQAPRNRSTRPMTDKLRAALFDILGPINGFVVLDVYAGSGAVGLEALSRGAARVTAIEAARTAQRVIEHNRRTLNLDWAYSLQAVTVEGWLARSSSQEADFDLIIADPPYEQLKTDVLEKFGQLLGTDGILAVSHSGRQPAPLLEGLQPATTRSYGDSAISFYRV